MTSLSDLLIGRISTLTNRDRPDLYLSTRPLYWSSRSARSLTIYLASLSVLPIGWISTSWTWPLSNLWSTGSHTARPLPPSDLWPATKPLATTPSSTLYNRTISRTVWLNPLFFTKGRLLLPLPLSLIASSAQSSPQLFQDFIPNSSWSLSSNLEFEGGCWWFVDSNQCCWPFNCIDSINILDPYNIAFNIMLTWWPT